MFNPKDDRPNRRIGERASARRATRSNDRESGGRNPSDQSSSTPSKTRRRKTHRKPGAAAAATTMKMASVAMVVFIFLVGLMSVSFVASNSEPDMPPVRAPQTRSTSKNSSQSITMQQALLIAKSIDEIKHIPFKSSAARQTAVGILRNTIYFAESDLSQFNAFKKDVEISIEPFLQSNNLTALKNGIQYLHTAMNKRSYAKPEFRPIIKSIKALLSHWESQIQSQ